MGASTKTILKHNVKRCIYERDMSMASRALFKMIRAGARSRPGMECVIHKKITLDSTGLYAIGILKLRTFQVQKSRVSLVGYYNNEIYKKEWYRTLNHK